MPILGIDDTDSRSGGMCTTWIGSEIVQRLPAGSVAATYLIRLHPAIEHKTRGNGAVAIVTDAPDALDVATTVVAEYAVHDDPNTNPGVVAVEREVADNDRLRMFARSAVRSPVTRETAADILSELSANTRGWGNQRGQIGATAAVGAAAAHQAPDRFHGFTDWTYEHIGYREAANWGTDRSVDVPDALPRAPAVWDTVDPVTGRAVCVPRSPCPVLLGVRGDDPDAIRRVIDATTGEPIHRQRTFITNQGTDSHLRPGRVGELADGRAYRVRGQVTVAPAALTGGHVTFTIANNGTDCACIAFSPTGRFRDVVRRLSVDDTIIACGEVGDGTLKLEKFALVGRRLTERTSPTCPNCSLSMKSAGQNQGYRCRTCGTSAPEKTRETVIRHLEPGWYEVPPDARRHLAKPLVRGQYRLPIHPTTG